MPHSICLLAFCEKTAEPVWLSRKLKLGLGQMFLNENIYHTFQNREQSFPKYIILQKRELPYIFCSILLSILNKILSRMTICLERNSSSGSFLSYKDHQTKLGGKVKTYLLTIPECMTLENKHWTSLSVGFLKSRWKEEYKNYLFVETVNMQGGKNLSQCLTNGSWDSVKSPLIASYSI